LLKGFHFLSSAYEAFYLHPELIKGLSSHGRKGPSPLQRRAIPLILDGRDAFLLAAPGPDPILAYGLPLLSLVDPAPQTQAVVLATDSMTVSRVATALDELSDGLSLRVLSLAGATNPTAVLRRGGEVLVGTPDQVFDLIDRGTLDGKHVRLVVLYGLDDMIEDGFRPMLEQVMGKCAGREQAIAVASGSDDLVDEFVRRHLKKATVVRTEREMTVPQAPRPEPRQEPRQERRPEPRAPRRPEPRTDVRESRDSRDVRSGRGPQESRAPRDSRDSRDNRDSRSRGRSDRSDRGGRSTEARPASQAPIETARYTQPAPQPAERPTISTGPLVPLPRFQTSWCAIRVPLATNHRYGRDSLHGWLAQQTGVPRSSMRQIVVHKDHATLEIEDRSKDRFMAVMPGCEVS
jgi:hypothetical protein